VAFPIKKNVFQELHVDDASCFLEVSKQTLLMETNFEIDTTTSANKATEKIGQKHYDVIVSDNQMSQNGLKLLNMLFNGTSESSLIRTQLGRD
jgi:DNA-binding NtrC family response regulator